MVDVARLPALGPAGLFMVLCYLLNHYINYSHVLYLFCGIYVTSDLLTEHMQQGTKRMPGTAVTKSVVANEPAGRKREEIFVDIIEKISVTFSSSVGIRLLTESTYAIAIYFC